MKRFSAVSCCQDLMAMSWQECGEQAQDGQNAPEVSISTIMFENEVVLFSHARVNPTGDCPQG